jgi:hypothetical protein
MIESVLFWKNIEKLKDSLLMNDQQFADELQMNLKDYLKIRGTKILLPMDKTFECAEKYNFHFEDLLKSDFKLKLNHSPTSLLPRYTTATYSFTKTSISIMKFLEEARGLRAKTNVLRKFQVSEEFLLVDTNKANVHLTSDIAQYIHETFNFTNMDFVEMGRKTPFVTENIFLKNKLTGHKSVKNMFSYFFEDCTNVFDSNCHYRIETLNDDFVIVAAIPKKEVVEELGVRLTDFCSTPASYSRAGIISSMSMFQFKMNTPIKKISCLNHGDQYDRYLLDLSQFKNIRSSLRIVH